MNGSNLGALLALSTFTAALVACGGSSTPAQDADSIDMLALAPTEGTTSGEPAAPAPDEPKSRLNPLQKEQMDVAIRRGQSKAAQCSDVVATAPSGEGEVQVVFDGVKGRVSDVIVGAPFATTPIEACIKRSFIGEIIMPFDGEPITLPSTVKIPPKKVAAEGTTKDKKP